MVGKVSFPLGTNPVEPPCAVRMMECRQAAGVMLSLRRSSLDGEMINDTFISGERESCESKKPPASLLAFFCQINLELLTEVLRRKNLAGGD